MKSFIRKFITFLSFMKFYHFFSWRYFIALSWLLTAISEKKNSNLSIWDDIVILKEDKEREAVATDKVLKLTPSKHWEQKFNEFLEKLSLKL